MICYYACLQIEAGVIMKIVGGSFGLSGSVSINYEKGVVFVSGASSHTYERDQLQGVDVEQSSESKIGCGSVLIGLLVITPLLTFFLNVIGLVIGLVLTVFGSRYDTKKHEATLRFQDGRNVRVQGSYREINRLPTF